MTNKKILYLAVAFKDNILAEYSAQKHIKFSQSMPDILKRLTPGKIIVSAGKIEYMLANDNSNAVVYIAAVDADFSQQLAFECLESMRNDFERFFQVSKAKFGRPLSLNDEFEGQLQRLCVCAVYDIGRLQH